MTRKILVCLLLLGACADRDRDVTSAKLGNVEYAVPEGWAMRDVSQNASTILVWTPATNPRKQSVTIIRTQPMPAMARADESRLVATLGETLRQPAKVFRTKQGIAGVRVDGRFAPPGSRATYARSHMVFADGDSLVHVIYTAADPDREVFDLVVDHLARKAG
jgi:hypothetical protein